MICLGVSMWESFRFQTQKDRGRAEVSIRKTTIVNKRKSRYDVYIGRPSIFGNPYPITKKVNREESIKLFKDYFDERIERDSTFKASILKLQGRKLGCFCAPKACHGDIIIDWLAKLPKGETNRKEPQDGFCENCDIIFLKCMFDNCPECNKPITPYPEDDV